MLDWIKQMDGAGNMQFVTDNTLGGAFANLSEQTGIAFELAPALAARRFSGSYRGTIAEVISRFLEDSGLTTTIVRRADGLMVKVEPVAP
jgi:hypothetical protein